MRITISLTGQELTDCISFLDEYLQENENIIAYESLEILLMQLKK